MAVSSIFTLDLVAAGFSDAELLIPLTFLVIVTTVVVCGVGAAPLVPHLGVTSLDPQGLLIVGADPWVRSLAKVLESEQVTVSLVDSIWVHVSAARRLGLTAHHGNVLSERVMEEIEFDGIGHLLGLTFNDEVNALAAFHFAEVFGSCTVYQLVPNRSGPDGKDRALPTNLRGRLLFDKEATHDRITSLFEAGASFEKVAVSEDTDIECLEARRVESTTALCLLNESGKLEVVAADNAIGFKAGQRTISLTTGTNHAND